MLPPLNNAFSLSQFCDVLCQATQWKAWKHADQTPRDKGYWEGVQGTYVGAYFYHNIMRYGWFMIYNVHCLHNCFVYIFFYFYTNC